MKRNRKSPARATRRGFTLVELIAAIIILVVGVLGLASTAAVVMRQINGAGMQTRAAVLAQSRFERLRSVNCATAVGGTATSGGITETWRTTMQNRSMQMVVVVTWPERGVTRSVTFTSQRPCV
jgi:prepilin-type N-terminal cleavage/methylation domain-containing protein